MNTNTPTLPGSAEHADDMALLAYLADLLLAKRLADEYCIGYTLPRTN